VHMVGSTVNTFLVIGWLIPQSYPQRCSYICAHFVDQGLCTSPASSRHQMVVDQIRATLTAITGGTVPCGCHHLADVAIRFPDGSLKRPDIAIFCTPPPMQDDALTLLPVAVIEIISLGYEYKDESLNPPFYLGHPLQDVVVVDPHAQRVTHDTHTGVHTQPTPARLTLTCGCHG
jgi:Putative restriction endonuclease